MGIESRDKSGASLIFDIVTKQRNVSLDYQSENITSSFVWPTSRACLIRARNEMIEQRNNRPLQIESLPYHALLAAVNASRE